MSNFSKSDKNHSNIEYFLSDLEKFAIIAQFWHFSNYAQQVCRTYWWTTCDLGLGGASTEGYYRASKDNEWTRRALGWTLYLTSCYRCFKQPHDPWGWLQVYLEPILHHRRRGLEVQYWGQLQTSTQAKNRKDTKTWLINNYFYILCLFTFLSMNFYFNYITTFFLLLLSLVCFGIMRWYALLQARCWLHEVGGSNIFLIIRSYNSSSLPTIIHEGIGSLRVWKKVLYD